MREGVEILVEVAEWYGWRRAAGKRKRISMAITVATRIG